MCKSDRKVRQLNSAQSVDFVVVASAWRAGYKAGWHDDSRKLNKRERRERDRIEKGNW